VRKAYEWKTQLITTKRRSRRGFFVSFLSNISFRLFFPSLLLVANVWLSLRLTVWRDSWSSDGETFLSGEVMARFSIVLFGAIDTILSRLFHR
jgi:hypothetical protein